MKKHLSKRLLSLFLAVMMVVTSAPFVASAADGYNGDDIRYLFAYFTGNDGEEQVRLAVSDDGLNFEALNGNKPVLSNDTQGEVYPSYASSMGMPASNCARDPYVIAKEDGNGYYILATDLNINQSSYRNSKLLVWDVNDLGNAGDVKPWNIETSAWFNNYEGNGYIGNYPDFYAWAPGAVYVPDRDMYLLYWSAGRAGDSRNTYDTGNTSNYETFGIYGVYTKDFKTFYDEYGIEMTADSQAMLLYNPDSYPVIDADITYDNGTYYMWCKDENGKVLTLATATSSNGEYTYQFNFEDTDYDSNLEGPFTYQLPDGRYVLMIDWYGDGYDNARFISYVSSDLENFMHNNIDESVNINYLKPRHGKICQIKASEYQDLIENYGKVTYSGQNYFGSGSVNDNLIARYFINDDINKDNTGNGYDLQSANISVGFDSARTYAQFNGGGQSVNGDSSYAQRAMSDMNDELNSKDGVTVSFYARNNSGNNNRRFFEFTTYNRGGWSDNSQAGSYVNFCADSRVEIQVGSYNNSFTTYGSGTAYNSDWHLYTMTISESFVTLSVDGIIQRQTPNTPIYNSNFTDSAFETITNGNLLIGCSSWSSDPMFSGDIYDFRIYNRALSNDEVQDSLNELGDASYVGENLSEDATAIFYDPMENVDTYTAYDQTVSDSSMGNVLQLSGSGIKAHDTYKASASDNGYTVSFWYNPGDSLDGVMLNIGQHSGTDETATKKYFTLEETGELWYCYNVGDAGNQSYADIKNIFGSAGLTTNEWQHIVIQIVPNGNYEILYVYIDGQLVNTFESYKSVDGNGNRTMKDNRTILNFFENENLDVWYGTGYFDGYNWGFASGLIDDVTIYNHSYSAYDVYRENAISHATTLLDTAMQQYLDKMSAIQGSSTIYTNMEPAYSAYNKARRYIDSVEKGNVDGGVRDAEHCAELFVDLVTKTNAMEPYNKPADIGGMTETQSGVSTAIDAQYTNNMLSSVNISRPMEWKGGTMLKDDEYSTDGGGQNMSLATGSFVWMYTGIDGDTPTAPINAGFYVNNFTTGASYFVHYLYITSGDVSLQSDWQFSNSSTVDWYYPNRGSYTVGLNPNASYGDCLQMSTDGQWFYGSNQMNYTGDESDFSNNNNASDYYIEIEPTFTGCIHTEWLDWGTKNQHNTPNDPDNPNSAFWPQGTIYVFNFAKVRDALIDSTRVGILSNIQNYTPDSVSDLLLAYDAITSQEYRFNSASEEAVEALAETVNQQVKDLEAVDVQNIEEFADGTELENTRDSETAFHDSVDILDNGDAMIPEGEENAGEVYTASSWVAYDNAYKAVQEYYAGLNPYGNNDQYATSQDQLDTLVDNIENAKAHLVARADYSPVNVIFDTFDEGYNGIYTQTINETNGTSYENQKYTYGSWKSFEDSYDAAESWYSKSDRYKADTEKYDTDYVQGDLSPYVGIDANGEVVTSDTQTPEWYMYVGEFYDNPDDSQPSQFETGDYIKIDGETIQLNGHRYAPETINRPTLSDRQQQINSDGANVDTTYNQLTEPVDYSAYDATTELLKYQDVNAFKDAEADEVYTEIREQGTKDATVTYYNGVASSSEGVQVDTPAYNDEATAYVVADGAVWMNQGDQNALDSETTYILTELEEVNTSTDPNGNRNSFNVTFSYYDAQNTLHEGSPETVFYGDSYTANIPEGLHVYKWVVTANGTTMEIPAAQSYTAYITSDTQIVAYCTEETTENQVTVQILNQYGHLVQEYAVNSDTQITVDKNVYNIGGQEYRVEDTPFYVFDGWQVNGHNYNNGTTFTVADVAEDGVVSLKMKFNVASGMYDVSMDGSTVHDELADTDGNAFAYDTLVTATPADGAYGIAIKIGDQYYAVSYGSEPYSFYTVGNVALYSITQSQDGDFVINGETVSDAETARKLILQLPFSYTIGQDSEGKFTSYSASTANLPEGVEITEVGTLYTTDPSVASNPNSFVLGADGVSYIAAKNQLDTEQYFLRINNGSTTVYTRSYIKYSFSDGVSASDHEYSDSTLIQTVDYGNIVVSD